MEGSGCVEVERLNILSDRITKAHNQIAGTNQYALVERDRDSLGTIGVRLSLLSAILDAPGVELEVGGLLDCYLGLDESDFDLSGRGAVCNTLHGDVLERQVEADRSKTGFANLLRAHILDLFNWKARDVGNSVGVGNRTNHMTAMDFQQDGEGVGRLVVVGSDSLPRQLNDVTGGIGVADESFGRLIVHAGVREESVDRCILGKLGRLGGCTDFPAVPAGEDWVGFVEGTLVLQVELSEIGIRELEDSGKNILLLGRKEIFARPRLKTLNHTIQLSVG